MRALLAVMAGMLCVAAGLSQAASLRASQARLRRWTELLEHLALILSEGSCTLPEAFLQASSSNQIPDRLLHDLAEDMQRQPMKSLPELWKALSVHGEESAPISRMMQRLCRGSLENRCQAVQQAAQELQLFSGQAREKNAKDAKMWRTLGFLGGACITIMLL